MKRIVQMGALVSLLSLCALPALANHQLLVNSTAALEGNYGLEIVIDGNNNASDAYVVTNHPNLEKTYNASFLIDPSNLNLAPNKYFLLGTIRKTTDPYKSFILIWIMKSPDNKFWLLQSNVRDDAGNLQPWQLPHKICGDNTTTIPCSTTTPIKFEFQWKAATAPGANDGYLKVIKRDVVHVDFLNIDNDTQTVDAAFFGAVFMSNATHGLATGSVYFDSFVSTR